MATKLALVVDDSRVARLTLNKILLGYGFTVVEQDSAEHALQWLEQQTERPDVIFMDLMMPGMDGISATQTLKANAAWRTIPVVVCTGNDSELDKSKASDSGAAAVLTKPPASESVQQIISQLPVNSADAVTSQTATPPPAALDETALLARLQQQLAAQWLPQLRSELLQQLNTQIDQQHQQPTDLQALKISLLPDLRQELQQTLDAALADLRQHAASDNHDLQQQAASFLQQAFQGFDVIGQWQSRLQDQASDWLSQQQLNVQDALTQQLTPLIEQKIQQQLSAKLDKVLNAQLETAMAQQNAALTSQLQTQRADLETAHKRTITLAWAAMGIALAALIISVI